jgi:FMN phosphatase YigB (HAD superfamily)
MESHKISNGMKIFLDFDDVVFNTKEFLVLLKSVFLEFGVSEEVFTATYKELRADGGGKGFCYRFDAQIAKIAAIQEVNKEGLLESLEKILADTSAFIFPDVQHFLQTAKTQGYCVDILSFGDEHFQAQKIMNSGVAVLVDRVMVTQESKEIILQNEQLDVNETTWFLDDRLHFLEGMKQAFPFMKTVLVSRPEGRFEEEKSDLCDYQTTSLKQAIEIIEAQKNHNSL